MKPELREETDHLFTETHRDGWLLGTDFYPMSPAHVFSQAISLLKSPARHPSAAVQPTSSHTVHRSVV